MNVLGNDFESLSRGLSKRNKLKIMKNIIIILASVFLLTACDKDSSGPNNLEQVFIGSGSLYGNGVEEIQKGNHVIESEFVWNALMARMNLVNEESQDFTETDIDFNKFVILAVFEDVMSSGGHSIQIEELIETNDAIKVLVERESPMGNHTNIMTQPFYISKIERPNKDIVFKE